MNTFYGLLSVIGISLASLIGVAFLLFKKETVGKFLLPLVGLAAGALFGDAFLHLIPEALEHEALGNIVPLFVLLGIVAFFILEKFLHWHHHHDADDHAHDKELPLGKMILFSDGLHNFLDGIIVAVAYSVSVPVGIATTIAVILHELPQEIGDFGLLVHAGYSRKKALFYNFLSSLSALLGFALASLFIVSDNFLVLASAFAAGSFIYIAGSDLVPELKRAKADKKSVYEFIFVLLGIGLMYLLLLLE
ncbi:MAG TPA: ZIP family metal transporter [Candidatus Paceibacterota bacterium]|nr:ZIP family metal transporter [Candidatus Paceibacterota bacterium]